MAKIGNEDITMAHSHAVSCAQGTCTRAERVCRALTDPFTPRFVPTNLICAGDGTPLPAALGGS
jgi:hypothetical protein